MTHPGLPWLEKVSMFQKLSRVALNHIAEISETISFYEDQTIFNDSEEADALYIIKNGQVRIEQNYRDGRKKTLAVLTSGNFFGEMALITSSKRCASAVSSGETEVIRIAKQPFLNCLKDNTEACFGILQVLCERLKMADIEISNLTFRNLPGRIVYKLFELADQFGIQEVDGTTIRLQLTHYDLADMVGTNRESVSKYLSKFKSEKSININRKWITIIDRSKLLAWT
jgi:CRP/FNR family transcriptional regulator, cyclic AMP receptor protein